MNKLLIPALVSGGVASYLALETHFDRVDRVVLFLLLFGAYVLAFLAMTVALSIGLRVFKLQEKFSTDSRRALECFLFLGPLLINVLLAVFGHKNIVFAAKPPLADHIVLQFVTMGFGLSVLYFGLRQIYRLPGQARRRAAATLWALIPLAMLLPSSTGAHARRDGGSIPTLSPPQRVANAPVVLIGLDGIDAKLLEAGIATGRLPRFRSFMEEGFVSRLDFGDVPLSPIIWTSLSTGKTRHQHGIHDFVTIRSPLFRQELGTWYTSIPPGFAVKSVMVRLKRFGLITERVANGLDRRGPSIWQLLSAHDMRSIVVNYMVSWPAEDVNGAFISQYMYHHSTDVKQVRPTAISPSVDLPSFGFENPPGVVETLELEPPRKVPTGPIELAEAEFEYVADIALRLAEVEPFDLLTFYTHWPDTFNHTMTPVDYESALSGEFSTEVSAELLACLARVDRFLADLAQRAETANFIVVSDHGVQLGHDGKNVVVQHVHAPPGIFLGAGPNISPNRVVGSISMLDVVPTLLTYYGLPVAEDMPGQVVQELLGVGDGPRAVATYDELIENSRVTPDEAPDLTDVEERLRALGYVQ